MANGKKNPFETTSAPVGRKLSRAGRVSIALKAAILNGDLEPGSKVNLEEMRGKFGVSLSPLREAMSRLTTTCLVEFEDQRGYRIAPLTRKNLEEVIRLRAELECLAVSTAIDVADLDWESSVLAALHHLTSLEKSSNARCDDTEWADAHRAFHDAMISGCGMDLLIEYCSNLHNQIERYRRILQGNARCTDHVAEEHIAMADAAVTRDRALAVSLVRGHIERVGAGLLAAMSEYPETAR